MVRRLLALGMFALVLSIALVVGDQSAAGACSCMPGEKPVMSTFVGRVESVSGDAFRFVDVVTEAGP